MFEIKLISPPETFPLRIKILRNGIAENYRFNGDDLPDTFHVGAFENEVCLGIATCLPSQHVYFSEKNTYQLRGMAVDVCLQNKGIGKLIISETLRILQERKINLLWCNARENAVDFYKKMGFIIEGEKFDISGIGWHYVMFKKL